MIISQICIQQVCESLEENSKKKQNKVPELYLMVNFKMTYTNLFSNFFSAPNPPSPTTLRTQWKIGIFGWGKLIYGRISSLTTKKKVVHIVYPKVTNLRLGFSLVSGRKFGIKSALDS